MDTDQLVAHGRARFEHAAARKLLKEKYKAKMIFAHAGGMWEAGPELLNILAVCNSDEAVISDLYEQPVRIKVQALRELTMQRWQEQMTAWLLDHEELHRRR